MVPVAWLECEGKRLRAGLSYLPMERSKQFREYADECERLAEEVTSEDPDIVLENYPPHGEGWLKITTKGVLNRDPQLDLSEQARLLFASSCAKRTLAPTR